MFASQTEGELKVIQILKEKFPRATAIKVTDISGGCGAMYEIKIESEEFKEKRTVQQHQMVNQALKEEIKGMHGLRIFTSVPKHWPYPGCVDATAKTSDDSSYHRASSAYDKKLIYFVHRHFHIVIIEEYAIYLDIKLKATDK